MATQSAANTGVGKAPNGLPEPLRIVIIAAMDTKGLNKRRLIIILILLIPAAWAGVVQVFVRRSPPSVAITVAMGDLLAAIGQIEKPDPKSAPYRLKYDLLVGEKWQCFIDATVSSSGDDLDQLIGEERHEPRPSETVQSGEYGIEVIDQLGKKWRLKIEAVKGGSLPHPYEFWLDSLGTMTAIEKNSSIKNVRDELFRQTGIYFPGPFPTTIRARERCGTRPSRTLGKRTEALVKRLKFKLADDRMPPKGGLIFMGPRADLDDTDEFKVLSYRRVQLEEGPWQGFVELLVRADYECAKGEIHLVSGTARLRDLIDLQKDRRLAAAREHSLLIKQTMKNSMGG